MIGSNEIDWGFCFSNVLLIKIRVSLDIVFEASMDKSDYAGIFLVYLASLLTEKQLGSQKARNCFKVI